MKKIKTFTITSFIICLSISAFSQLGIRTALLKPSGELGEIFKPKLAFEFMFHTDFEDQFGIGYFISYCKLKPLHDEFPGYALFHHDNIVELTPSYTKYLKHSFLTVGGSIEYKFFDKHFSPIVGVEAVISMINRKYEHSNALVFESVDDNTAYLGIVPKTGILYQEKNKFDLLFEFGKCLAVEPINQYYELRSYWKTSITYIYLF